jgi:DNA-binding transcriptional MocR family regulator
LHNPTTVTLSTERRIAIADVARAHGTQIIEDDVYRPLKSDAPPSFITTAPDITIYVSSFSKCVSPGLRVGAVLAPKPLVADIAAMLRINCWSTSPLNALVAARMIEDGSVERIISSQKDEFMLRQTIVRETLGAFDIVTDDAAPHAWLNLPEPWQGNAFARVASQNGVGILPGEAFAIDRTLIPHAVRINVGAARSREDLRRALETLRKILSGDRRVFEAVV